VKVLCTSTKIRTKLEGRWTFHGRLFAGTRSKHDLQALVKLTEDSCDSTDSIDSVTLFSKIVLNKLQYSVKHEITLICAKFGADVVKIF